MHGFHVINLIEVNTLNWWTLIRYTTWMYPKISVIIIFLSWKKGFSWVWNFFNFINSFKTKSTSKLSKKFFRVNLDNKSFHVSDVTRYKYDWLQIMGNNNVIEIKCIDPYGNKWMYLKNATKWYGKIPCEIIWRWLWWPSDFTKLSAHFKHQYKYWLIMQTFWATSHFWIFTVVNGEILPIPSFYVGVIRSESMKV